MRNGLSLIELLVVIVIGLIIFAGMVLFFSSNYKLSLKTVARTKVNVSVFHALNLINMDLIKAGYGIRDTSKYPPVLWDTDNKKLIIRYVDYDREGCDNETYGNNDCSFVVVYKLDDNKQMLYRAYHRNGVKDVYFPLFNGEIIKVKDFYVLINKYSHKVEYGMELEYEGKIYYINNTVVCRNWKYEAIL